MITDPARLAEVRFIHEQLVKRTAEASNNHRILFDNCNAAIASSLIFMRCDCTDNPDCTGFVIGALDMEYGERCRLMVNRETLEAFALAILKELGQ